MFASAQTKQEQAQTFFDQLISKKKEWVNDFSNLWRIKLDQERVTVNGYSCIQGSIIGNYKKLETKISELSSNDFMRKYNKPLFSSELSKWAIIYSVADKENSRVLRKMLKENIKFG